jgi:hypothetical protein
MAVSVPVNPDAGALPGTKVLEGLANGLSFWALLAAVVALVAGAALWAIGSNSQNIHQSMAGRRTVVASLIAGLLVGAAPHLIMWLFNLGGKVA